MKLANQFKVSVDPDSTWRALLDVPRIVSCVPGPELISRDGDGSYKGRIGVKLGPVALKFTGTMTIAEIDNEARKAIVKAKGADQQGRGSAGAITQMQDVPDGVASTLLLETDMQLSGMAAHYGRATGVIAALSNDITAQFANARCRQLTNENGGVEAAGTATQPLGQTVRHAQAIPMMKRLWRALLTGLGLSRIEASR